MVQTGFNRVPWPPQPDISVFPVVNLVQPLEVLGVCCAWTRYKLKHAFEHISHRPIAPSLPLQLQVFWNLSHIAAVLSSLILYPSQKVVVQTEKSIIGNLRCLLDDWDGFVYVLRHSWRRGGCCGRYFLLRLGVVTLNTVVGLYAQNSRSHQMDRNNLEH